MFSASSIKAFFSCSDTSIRARGRGAGSEQHIRIDKAFALRDLSHLDIHWFAEHWPIESKGMKFSSLATRINVRWKRRQELFLNSRPAKLAGNCFGSTQVTTARKPLEIISLANW